MKLEEIQHKRDHKQRRRKRATLAIQEEEFEKGLSLHWHIYFVLHQRSVSYNCFLSLHLVGLISRRADYPSTVGEQ